MVRLTYKFGHVTGLIRGLKNRVAKLRVTCDFLYRLYKLRKLRKMRGKL